METALGRLQLLWAKDPDGDGAYDLAPAARRSAAAALSDDDGWIDLKPPATDSGAAKSSRMWWISFTDEFAGAFQTLHRALHQELFASIRNIARDPEPHDTPLARPLAVEVENLWCWRLGNSACSTGHSATNGWSC